jgi:uncharacterized protein YkwD
VTTTRILLLALPLALAVSCGKHGDLRPLCGAEVPEQAGLDPGEAALLRLVNEYRRERGARELSVSVVLSSASQWMSEDMTAGSYFSHSDSLGRDAAARLAAFGFDGASGFGENIARGEDAERAFKSWRSSRGHDELMRSEEFVSVGFGRAGTGSESVWVAAFGGRCD